MDGVIYTLLGSCKAKQGGVPTPPTLDVGWAFQPNNETDLDVKMPRGIDAWSVSVELFSCFAAALYCNKLDSFAVARNDD